MRLIAMDFIYNVVMVIQIINQNGLHKLLDITLSNQLLMKMMP